MGPFNGEKRGHDRKDRAADTERDETAARNFPADGRASLPVNASFAFMGAPSAGARLKRAVAVGIGSLIVCTAGCRGSQGAGALHARHAELEREVKGLRASVEKLERGDPILPQDAVVVAIGERVVKDFVTAQLPLTVDLESYRIVMTQAEATFKGSPSVDLTGSIVHKNHPDLVGEVRALGALEGIVVDPKSGTLRARVAVDHVDLLKMGGLEKFLGGGTLDDLGRAVRLQLAPRIPPIEIPVKIEQAVDLPDVTDGPVLIRGASLPLAVGVADVLAGQGVLWIAINVVPGEMTRPGEPAAAGASP
jgi:hypothetical protein